MRAFDYSVRIERPPAAVFAFMMDFSNWPKWGSLVQKLEIVGDGDLGVGSQLMVTVEVGGRIRRMTSEVWAFEPGRRYGVRNTADGVTGVFEYRLEPEQAGTRIRFSCDIRPHGLMWLVLPWLLKGSRVRYCDQLDRLKQIIERDVLKE
jgi:carbon monoxide dehydrogenase subunit G